MITQGRPKIAIIDPNTLAALGLKSILQNVLPIMTIDTYDALDKFKESNPDEYVHYFVSFNIVLEDKSFFMARRMKTIVLTLSMDASSQISGFHCICINVPEDQLIKSLLILEQYAHANGKNLPPVPKVLQQKILSDRELEVLALIVQGFINKEIADKLNIGLATVVTHRKNIMDKLGVKSVSALTIYAVMHGYVDINKI